MNKLIMVNIMYKKITKEIIPSNFKIKKIIISFVVGGLIGIIGQLLIDILSSFNNISINEASNIMMISLVFISSLLTGLGIFDHLVTKTGAGLIVPITGFAHATTSSAMEYRKEGLVFGIGSNIFKMSGSVILYGVVSSYICALIKYLGG